MLIYTQHVYVPILKYCMLGFEKYIFEKSGFMIAARLSKEWKSNTNISNCSKLIIRVFRIIHNRFE